LPTYTRQPSAAGTDEAEAADLLPDALERSGAALGGAALSSRTVMSRSPMWWPAAARACADQHAAGRPPARQLRRQAQGRQFAARTVQRLYRLLRLVRADELHHAVAAGAALAALGDLALHNSAARRKQLLQRRLLRLPRQVAHEQASRVGRRHFYRTADA
jgi:hypothetical protein